MDGENNGGTPYEQMDDLGVPLFLETPIFNWFTFWIKFICQFNLTGLSLVMSKWAMGDYFPY